MKQCGPIAWRDDDVTAAVVGAWASEVSPNLPIRLGMIPGAVTVYRTSDPNRTRYHLLIDRLPEHAIADVVKKIQEACDLYVPATSDVLACLDDLTPFVTATPSGATLESKEPPACAREEDYVLDSPNFVPRELRELTARGYRRVNRHP